MSRPERFSAQTLLVLAALSGTPSQWRHGYDLAKETALKSGTLYPILIRLADRGLVEAAWEAEQPAGRPRRHLYRLTNAGIAAFGSFGSIGSIQSNQAQPSVRGSASGRTRTATPARPRRRIAAEGA